MGGISVATIRDPEFVNITSISPLVSKCEIKVLYIGQNRNRSYITKEVATEMAQSLPGCPIVGYYLENKEDFSDHGEQMIIDGEGIKINKLTKPYGFVAPDSKVWFQEFEDTDEFGNKIIREYLMTEGYLWTSQYEECQRVIDKGNPQSMELDEKTLKGHWSTDNNSGIEFFIINDAIFSKLCILGEDVEPCFEGAAVTAPEVSSNFTKNDDFVKTLFTMMQELKELTFSLQNKGGTSMADVINTEFTEEQNAAPIVEEKETENFSIEEGKDNSETNVENDTNVEEFKKNDDEEAKEENSDDVDAKEDDKDDEEDPKKNHSLEEKFALVEEELKELKSQYASLQEENKKLLDFQKTVEDEKKDALINSFYMLSDEDKKDVIENKTNYTLDEIEAKLSVICVRKKVNFNLDDENVNNDEEQPALIYNLNNVGNDDSLPAWLKAVEEKRNANN
jgi:hypothetical protein